MLSVDTQTLADLLNKASRGRFGLDKAKQIQQTAKNSFGIVLASSSFVLIIRQYLEQLKSLESSITAFDTKLETITGVGKTLAAVVFSEIGGDIKKFSSLPKLDAYLSKEMLRGKRPFDCHWACLSQNAYHYFRRPS